jgi:glycosyltransferase involved in cell wall biosynthesis
LRAQTDRRWVCLVSDDASSSERFEQVRAVIGDDPRFEISRAEERRGHFLNFERVLGMVPADAELVALCDQDDRWYPDKLEALRAGLGDALLVYSDQRLVDAHGRVLRPTMWEGRRNNHDDLISMLVANTITGAAMLFRRELAELAIPFPDAPGVQFHDHWLGFAALAAGDVAYVDRPLYDYVQHAGAVFGEVTQGPAARVGPLARAQGLMAGWRSAYFEGYLARAVHAQTALVRFPERLIPSKRRALERFVGAAGSPAAWAWLALRPLRELRGRNETLGSERALAAGIVWRAAIEARARRGPASLRLRGDATTPEDGAFQQRRIRRWRARL